jgi:uncharacterized integral membrane protein (TIGR00697 family)
MQAGQETNKALYFGPELKILVSLILLYFTLDYVSTLCAHRAIILFGFTIIGASLTYPLTYSISDLITEVYGYKISMFLIVSMFIFGALFLGIGYLINLMPSPPNWKYNDAYSLVMHGYLVAFISGCLGYLVGATANVYILTKLKILMLGRFFFLRAVISTLSGIFIHTIITDYLMLIGEAKQTTIVSIIVLDNTTNVLFAVFGSFIIMPLALYLKARFKLDPYESIRNFNPYAKIVSKDNESK